MSASSSNMVAALPGNVPKLPQKKDEWRISFEKRYIGIADEGRFLTQLVGVPGANAGDPNVAPPTPADPPALLANGTNYNVVRLRTSEKEKFELAKAKAWNFILQISCDTTFSSLVDAHTSTRNPFAAWQAIVQHYESGAYES